ncbi:hypothetical protein C8F01DRAFT_285122 [Mycena amicta]|nr:hypothetical protein C8F01DRAFT_285122 [Mycena amicta]
MASARNASSSPSSFTKTVPPMTPPHQSTIPRPNPYPAAHTLMVAPHPSLSTHSPRAEYTSLLSATSNTHSLPQSTFTTPPRPIHFGAPSEILKQNMASASTPKPAWLSSPTQSSDGRQGVNGKSGPQRTQSMPTLTFGEPVLLPGNPSETFLLSSTFRYASTSPTSGQARASSVFDPNRLSTQGPMSSQARPRMPKTPTIKQAHTHPENANHWQFAEPTLVDGNAADETKIPTRSSPDTSNNQFQGITNLFSPSPELVQPPPTSLPPAHELFTPSPSPSPPAVSDTAHLFTPPPPPSRPSLPSAKRKRVQDGDNDDGEQHQRNVVLSTQAAEQRPLKRRRQIMAYVLIPQSSYPVRRATKTIPTESAGTIVLKPLPLRRIITKTIPSSVPTESASTVSVVPKPLPRKFDRKTTTDSQWHHHHDDLSAAMNSAWGHNSNPRKAERKTTTDSQSHHHHDDLSAAMNSAWAHNERELSSAAADPEAKRKVLPKKKQKRADSEGFTRRSDNNAEVAERPPHLDEGDKRRRKRTSREEEPWSYKSRADDNEEVAERPQQDVDEKRRRKRSSRDENILTYISRPDVLRRSCQARGLSAGATQNIVYASSPARSFFPRSKSHQNEGDCDISTGGSFWLPAIVQERDNDTAKTDSDITPSSRTQQQTQSLGSTSSHTPSSSSPLLAVPSPPIQSNSQPVAGDALATALSPHASSLDIWPHPLTTESPMHMSEKARGKQKAVDMAPSPIAAAAASTSWDNTSMGPFMSRSRPSIFNELDPAAWMFAEEELPELPQGLTAYHPLENPLHVHDSAYGDGTVNPQQLGGGEPDSEHEHEHYSGELQDDSGEMQDDFMAASDSDESSADDKSRPSGRRRAKRSVPSGMVRSDRMRFSSDSDDGTFSEAASGYESSEHSSRPKPKPKSKSKPARREPESPSTSKSPTTKKKKVAVVAAADVAAADAVSALYNPDKYFRYAGPPWPQSSLREFCHHCRCRTGKLSLSFTDCPHSFCVRCVMVKFPPGTVPFEQTSSSDNCPRCKDTCPCDSCCARRGEFYRPLVARAKGPPPSAEIVKSPRRKRTLPLPTQWTAPQDPALDQIVVDAVVPYAIMYNLNDEPVAYTYFDVDDNEEPITDVVVAKPKRFRRVFIGAVQECWKLAPNPLIFIDPLVRTSKQRNGKKRWFIGDESVLDQFPHPIAADAPPQMVDEPPPTDQDQDEVPSNVSSPLSPPPPNRFPESDESDSETADHPPLFDVLQVGDGDGSNEMVDVPMPLVEYDSSDNESRMSDEPRPTDQDEVPPNPEASSSPLSSPPPPNHIPDSDSESVDHAPLQLGDGDGSSAMVDLSMSLVQYDGSDNDSSLSGEPRPIGQDEVHSNPEASSSPLSSPDPASSRSIPDEIDSAEPPPVSIVLQGSDLPMPLAQDDDAFDLDRASSPLSSLDSPSPPADVSNDISLTPMAD